MGGGGGGVVQRRRAARIHAPATKTHRQRNTSNIRYTLRIDEDIRTRVCSVHTIHTHRGHTHTLAIHTCVHTRGTGGERRRGTERACFAEATEKNWPDDGERCEATHTRRRCWRWRRRPDGRSGRKRCGTRYARNDGTIPSVRLRRFFGGTKTPAVAAVEARARACRDRRASGRAETQCCQSGISPGRFSIFVCQ